MAAFFRGFFAPFARLWRDPAHRAMLVLFLVGSWLMLAVYQGQVVRDLPVAVVDRDNSELSRTLRLALSSSPDLRVASRGFRSVEEAHQEMVTGELAGVVLIPADFSTRIKKGDQGRLVIAVDMSNILIGKNAYKAISRTVQIVSAGVQASMAEKAGERKAHTLSRVVPIVVTEALPSNPAANYSVYVVPGLLLWSLSILVLLVTASLFRPQFRPPTDSGLFGSLVGVHVMGVLLGLACFYLLLPEAKIFPASSPAVVLLLLALAMVAIVLMAVAANAIIPDPTLAMQITIVIGMLSMMFSGITWPTDMFPPAIAKVATFIPFTPFAKGFQMFLHLPVDLGDLSTELRQLGKQTSLLLGLTAVGLGLRLVTMKMRARRRAA